MHTSDRIYITSFKMHNICNIPTCSSDLKHERYLYGHLRTRKAIV